MALLGAAPLTARAERGADARRATARTLFDEGLDYADAGRWQEAADRFRRAYLAKPTAEIGYNLAQAYVHLGSLSAAAELFRRAAVDPEAPLAVRKAAQARLVQVAPRLGRLSVRPEPRQGALVAMDGRALDPDSLGVLMPVDPGPHLLEARWGHGQDLSRRVTVPEGAEVTVVLSPPAPPPPPPEPPRSILRRGWFWVAVVGVAAGTAVALSIAQGRDSSPGPSTSSSSWHIEP